MWAGPGEPSCSGRCRTVWTMTGWRRCCSRRYPRGGRPNGQVRIGGMCSARCVVPDVTMALLWEEYRAGAPDGFGYSWFCDLYRGWAGRLKPTMRQTHIAGEKLFVDFAGRTGEVVDGLTGEIIPVQIFVAVLGASSLTYA